MVTPIPFPGFGPGKSGFTRLPEVFFSDLLPHIDDLAELKVTLYCFWAVQQREGVFRYVRERDVLDDSLLLAGFAVDPTVAARLATDALAKACSRGTLLMVLLPLPGEHVERLYFINTERGRQAVAALEAGAWEPGPDDLPVLLAPARPNIFALYEDNIGPMTPLLADMLRDAEQTYPPDWIEGAVQYAVERNIRNWKYVESILKRWYKEGKYEPGLRATDPQNRGEAGGVGEYERFWDPD